MSSEVGLRSHRLVVIPYAVGSPGRFVSMRIRRADTTRRAYTAARAVLYLCGGDQVIISKGNELKQEGESKQMKNT